MPELPEVETIARGLASQILHQTVTEVSRISPHLASRLGPDCSRRIAGKKITGVWRRAKLLLMNLDGDLVLVFHLKMTGRVLVLDPGESQDKHVHFVAALDSGKYLVFQDQRKFGYVLLMGEKELHRWSFFSGLGPEPLDMTQKEFISRMQGRKASVKSLLLNQAVIAGIGNIYADESLHLAGIHPATPVSSLTKRQLAQLFSGLQSVLQKALVMGGSSFRDYVNALGRRGSFQEEFAVYGQKGGPCGACKNTLQTVKVAGRTSTYCPCCQPVRTHKEK